MNAKKICALALSLGLSASFAPKSDACIIKDAAKVVLGYAGYKTASIVMPKLGNDYATWWEFTVKAGEFCVKFIKGGIDKGVDAAIKFAEEKIELVKKSEGWKKYLIDNENNNIFNENNNIFNEK